MESRSQTERHIEALQPETIDHTPDLSLGLSKNLYHLRAFPPC